MKKIKELIDFIPGIYDSIFKRIILKEENIDYLKTIISLTTNISFEQLSNLKILNSEPLVKNKHFKKIRVDILLENNNDIILIEMNKNYYPEYINRNYYYLYRVGSTLYKVSDKTFLDRKLILINIDNFDYYKDNKLVYCCSIRNNYSSQIDNRNLKIYHLNLKYLKDKCYNKNTEELSKLEKYLMMLIAKEEVLRKKLEGDDNVLINVNKTLNEFNAEELELLLPDDSEKEQQAIMDYQFKLGTEKGIKLGTEKGIKLGTESGIKKIALNLYQNNIPIDIIVKTTGINKNKLMKLIH